MAAQAFCPACRGPLQWVAQYNQWWCANCRQYRQPLTMAQPGTPPPQTAPQPMALAYGQPATTPAGLPAAPAGAIWFANYYKIRKKVLAIANQYWIEDQAGRVLGYSRQKILRLKEDIRIYTDESMRQELFRIQQRQILDMWGTFDVIDSFTNTRLGTVRRRALSSAFVRDEYEIHDPWGRLVGEMKESTGRGMARKYLPGGALIPEEVHITLMGQPVATISQQFKIIGDVWEVVCTGVPPQFDRRVFLGCMLLMGMIERQRK